MQHRRLLALTLGAALLTACSGGQVPSNQQAAAWTPPPAPTSFVPSPPALLPTSESPASPLGRPTAAPAPTVAPRATYTVERGEVLDELTLSGRIMPAQLPLAFGQDGILERLLVGQGQQVEAGALIAELALDGLDTQLTQAQVGYEQDQAALDQANQQGRLLVEQAQINLDEARARLAEAKQPAAPADIAAARAAVQQANANLSTVRNDYSATKTTAEQDLRLASQMLEEAQKRYSDLYHGGGEGDADQQQALAEARRAVIEAEDRVARAKIAYDTAYGNEIAAIAQAEADVAVAQANLEELLRGPNPAAIGDAERDVQRATVALRQAQQDARPNPDLVKRIAAGRAEIDRIQGQIAGMRLYAPFAGVVASIEASPGAPVRAGLPLAVLIDSSRQELVASPVTRALAGGRAPTAAPQVAVGQPAEIVFSRYSTQPISGTISRAPLAGAADLAGATVPVYHLDYDAPGLTLELGDLAEIRLVLGRKYDTLWLPVEAVTFADVPFVTLRDGDTERRVDVQVGLVGAERIEILSGLQENDVVVVR